VVLSLYDLAFDSSTYKGYNALRSIRVFKALRVLKIAKFIKELRFTQVITSVVSAILK
jgi:hypothetical protein